MHARYVTSLLSGLLGGFVLVASQVFVPGDAAWLAFAFGIGLLVLTPIPLLFGDRGYAGLGLDGLAALLAIWTIVASLVFTGETVKWLSFSEGAAFVLLAVGGLTLNQVRLALRISHAAPAAVPASLTSSPVASDGRTPVAA
ncbi:MAG: hypothetical protein FWC87_11565 [Acidimicrobiaceae bacterium]|nr:hypothetical protein [Acidimicrobiaceae bacterium]